MTKIKLCGLSRMEDILAVNKIRPDYAGFVFAKSKRQVTPAQAEQLSGMLLPQIRSVGVFVNAELELIAYLCGEHIIDMVQLHGDEDTAYIEKLQGTISCPVIKAVRARSREQIREAEALPCDYLLLDTYTPGEYGGSGKQFDLSLVPALTKPFFLAGGLGPETVAERIRQVKPYGVDASSSLETDGVKDRRKMAAFAAAVRTGGNQ